MSVSLVFQKNKLYKFFKKNNLSKLKSLHCAADLPRINIEKNIKSFIQSFIFSSLIIL